MIIKIDYWRYQTTHLLEVALKIYRQDLEKAEELVEFAKRNKRVREDGELEVLNEDIRKLDEIIKHERRKQKSPAGEQTDGAKTETTTTKEA